MQQRAPVIEAPSRRQGPRPLALHLATAMLTWMSSAAVSTLSSSASPLWKAELRSEAAEVAAAAERLAPGRLSAAVAREGSARLARFLAAVDAYRAHPWRRDLDDPPPLAEIAGSRVLDYRRSRSTRSRARPVLLVPSLINGHQILDLRRERSFVRALAAAGAAPFVVDWGEPGAAAAELTLTDYVTDRLEPALDAVRAATGRPPVVLGYCMGGLLALALAERRRADVAGLVLLASPYDFHAERPERARLLAAALPLFEPAIAATGTLPVDAVQALFHALDPLMVPRKFLAFGRLDPGSPEAAAFVALEDWLNGGPPLAAPVAREALGGWYGANTPARGEWRIAGRAVDARAFDQPALVMVPRADRIVPPGSASALADALPRADLVRVGAGHIGMIAGRSAPETVWRPISDWIAART